MGLIDLQKWFKQVADIFYLSTSSDGHGGYEKVWVKKYSRQPCRIFGTSSSMTIQEQGVNYPVTSELMCDPTVEIDKGDKIEADGKHYMVLRAYKPQTDEDHHLVCLLGQMEEQNA